jgi:chemotaxis protein histidine kinase CheA
VTFDDDLELQRLFGGEVVERSEALVQGARSLASGVITAALLEDMYREGHTIKGTARMMGFIAISDAGKLLEDAWRALRDDEVRPSAGLSSALESLATELAGAVSADPGTGTPGLAVGMRAVRVAMKEEPDEPVDPVITTRTAPASEPGDLGGLLGTLDSWAFGENIRVDAAGLYRLINEVCALRVDAEALQSTLDEVTRSVGEPDALGSNLDRLGGLIGRTEKAVVGLQDRAVELASAPLGELTGTYRQLVRYLARKADKEIRFELVGDHHSADRQVLEGLSDPLRQLIVNAIEHGIETVEEREAQGKPPTATLSVRFEVVDHRLLIVVEDDGRGIDWAAVRAQAVRQNLLPEGVVADTETLRALLFSPNFSTSVPSDLVGDGMGLNTVAEAIETLHGTIVLESESGSGTRVVLTVPTSRALQDAVLIRAAGQTWGIPELAILDRVPIEQAELSTGQVRLEMAWDGTVVPVSSFADVVGLGETGEPTVILVVSSPIGPVGFSVEEDLGRRQVAARQLGPVLDGVPHLTGAALLGGGDVVVLVDPARLAERIRAVPDSGARRSRVLVVDDSRGARQIVGGALGSAGFEVDLAGSPTEALSVLADQGFDAIVLDYVLPTMDGATLAGHIRALGIEAPIVILSGAATAADRAKALESGADAYLDKDDVRKGALAALIRDLIE